MMLTAGGFDSVNLACKLIQLHWQLEADGPGLAGGLTRTPETITRDGVTAAFA